MRTFGGTMAISVGMLALAASATAVELQRVDTIRILDAAGRLVTTVPADTLYATEGVNGGDWSVVATLRLPSAPELGPFQLRLDRRGFYHAPGAGGVFPHQGILYYPGPNCSGEPVMRYAWEIVGMPIVAGPGQTLYFPDVTRVVDASNPAFAWRSRRRHELSTGCVTEEGAGTQGTWYAPAVARGNLLDTYRLPLRAEAGCESICSGAYPLRVTSGGD